MSSQTREVVSLQLGHYSNFVGTHWWNIQESSFVYSPAQADGPKEVNHDVLFREGRNLLGEVTFTPRLIAVDLKGSLNTLREEGSLYDIPTPHDADVVLWGDDVTLHQLEKPKKNEFLQDMEKLENGEPIAQEENSSPESDRDESVMTVGAESDLGAGKQYNLDAGVGVWSDFLRTHLHPKSVHQLRDYQKNNELHRFDMFGYGRQVAGQSGEREALEDRLHYFLEECDQLQGLHVTVDTHDGFGGLGASLIEHIQDDYGTRKLVVYGVTPPTFTNNSNMDRGYRTLNSVLAYNSLSASGAAFIPLSSLSNIWHHSSPSVQFPHLNYNPELWYHTSAVLGASLDTTSLPYRLHTAPSHLSHLTDALTAGGRKILGLQTSLPFPFLGSGNLYSSLMDLGEEAAWRPITPLYSSSVDPFCQSVVLRGIQPSQIKGPLSQSMPRDIRLAETADEVMELYLRERFSTSLSAVCTIRQPTKIAAPFPNIFGPSLGQQGQIETRTSEDTKGVESVRMMTSLQASPSTVELLQTMEKHAKGLKLKMFSNLLESGVEEDEYLEALNSLQTLTEVYRSDMESIY